MQNYHDLIQRVLDHGVLKSNRTGIDTLMVPAGMLQYDLTQGFPAITTKKLAFNAMKGELLGFFNGFQNAAQFRELNCKIWDANANETSSWVNSPYRKGTDDLGRIYGAQWTDWKDWETATTILEYDALLKEGYSLVAHDKEKNIWVMQKSINQVEGVLNTLLTNPTDRRMIVSGWRPDEFKKMALPPCHVLYNFLANPDTQELHLVMYQRSADVGLGVPFNIASSALFLELMARLSGFTAKTLTLYFADVHVYVNHVEPLKQQLLREHYPSPKLVISSNVRKVTDVREVKGAFTKISPQDISLEGYQCHPTIPMDMAA